MSATEPCLLEDALISPAHGLARQVLDHYLPGLLHNLHHPHRERSNSKTYHQHHYSGPTSTPVREHRQHEQHHNAQQQQSQPQHNRQPTRCSDGKEIHKEDCTHESCVDRHEHELRNLMFNIDGTGIGWYTSAAKEFGESIVPRPALYKTVRPPMTDPNFRSICANTQTKTLFAHIRAATSQVHEYNNHPFQFGCHLFQHNGAIAYFTEIRRQMCAAMSMAAYENVKGTTDTEHVAALYFSFLGDFNVPHTLEEMRIAMEKAIHCIVDIQKKSFDRGTT
jgi:predicted glutamine amidotransferase